MSIIYGYAVVYVFEGNPYRGGKLRTQGADLTQFKQLPLYTSSNYTMSVVTHVYIHYRYIVLVYYPLEAGEYVPIVFISGFYGIIPGDLYSDTLEHLASHGYVVIAIDTVIPSANSDSVQCNLAKKVYEEIQWV